MSIIHRLLPGFAVIVALGLGYLYGLHERQAAQVAPAVELDGLKRDMAAIRALLDAAPSRQMPSVAIPVATHPPINPWITLVERTCPECPTS